jgi:hypothetical protein
VPAGEPSSTTLQADLKRAERTIAVGSVYGAPEETTMAERATPTFTKSPPELVERFAAVMADYPDTQRKPMFGYPAAFVGGNMATGLFGDSWVVRLPDGEIDAAKAAGAGSFEPMPGKPMKAFVTIPPADVDDDEAIRRWVERGLALAASMPAKK